MRCHKNLDSETRIESATCSSKNKTHISLSSSTTGLTSTRVAASLSKVGRFVDSSDELSCLRNDVLFLKECFSSFDKLVSVRFVDNVGLLGDEKSTSSRVRESLKLVIRKDEYVVADAAFAVVVGGGVFVGVVGIFFLLL